MVVAIQSGDVQIRVAVVIVICRHHALGEAHFIDARCGTDFRKRAVPLVEE